MQFLKLLTALNGLLQFVLQVVKSLKFQKGIKEIKKEISQKDDQKTKKTLEEIL